MSDKNDYFRIGGLVLEGGAMRGMYTAGILDTLLDFNIRAEKVVGVSAGALFGVNFLSEQKGRVIRYNKRFNSDHNYLGLKPYLKEGNIVDTDYAYRRVPHELDPFDNEKFKQSGSDFYAVVTNVKTAEPEYIKITDVFEQMDVLRASGSMPILSKPVQLNDNIYLDGAISDSVPFEWMVNQGPEKIVVILTRDISYRKKAMNRLLTNYYKKKFPEFSEKMASRHDLYNSQIDRLKQLEQEGRVFVIRPSEPIGISRAERDPDKLQSVYDLGVRDAFSIKESLIAYLK